MFVATELSVRFGKAQILDKVNFSAQAGEVTVIVGPNGSGKTTLLKTLCNDHDFAGGATLHGQNVRDLTPASAACMRAVLPQASALSFPFTVHEVVALGLTGGRPGVAMAQLQSLPERALQAVDLAGFAGRFYGELSGGEQQRVQLARVLCQVWEPVLDDQPRFLMLDEPVSSLDIKHQLQILGVARSFAQAGGGVIAVLHDLNLAAMFADRITVMKNGQVCVSGTPRAVLNDKTIAYSFDCALRVDALPKVGMPFVLPQTFLPEERQ